MQQELMKLKLLNLLPLIQNDLNFVFPSIKALFPFVLILAPIRFNSATCINLFSKISSLIIEIFYFYKVKPLIVLVNQLEILGMEMFLN